MTRFRWIKKALVLAVLALSVLGTAGLASAESGCHGQNPPPKSPG